MNRTKLWFTLLIFATWLLGLGGDCATNNPTTPPPETFDVMPELLITPATPRPNELIAIRGTTTSEMASSVGGLVVIYRGGASAANFKHEFMPSDPDQVGTAVSYSNAGLTGSVDFNVQLPEGQYTVYVYAEATQPGDGGRTLKRLAFAELVVSDCGPPPSVGGNPILSLERGDFEADATIDLGVLPAGPIGPIPLGISGGVAPLRFGGGRFFESMTPNGEMVLRDPEFPTSPRRTMIEVIDSCSPPRLFRVAVLYQIVSNPCSTPAPRFDAARLVPGSISFPMNFQLAAVDGEPPFTYAVVAGSQLPPGLSLEGDRIVGTPTQEGEFDTTFSATDSCATPRTTSAMFHFEIAGAGVCPPIVAGAWTGTIANLTQAYSHQINVVGGVPPITFATNASTEFPPGLTLNGDRIEGTPTVAGSYSVNLTAQDQCNAPLELILPIQVRCAPFAISTTALADAVVGQPYSQTIATTGGLAPVTFVHVDGVLPAGLTFTGNAITGTPTVAATRQVIIRATDSCSPPQISQREFTLVSASSCPPINFNSFPLPDGDIGVAYSIQLTPSGGQAPISLSLRPGNALPPGLTLSGQGHISGLPTANGTFQFSLHATDSCTPPQVLERHFQIRIGDNECGALLDYITDQSLPAGAVHVPYNTTIEATGGVPPYTFVVDDLGGLPPGLVLSTSGVLSGTPTQAVAANFVAIRVTDSCAPEPQTLLSTFVISIASDCPALSFDTTSLPPGVLDVPYSFQLTASGGVPPRVFDRSGTSGPLPAGLTLSSSGLISGTPTMVGTRNVRLEVTDACDPPQTSSKQLSIEILPQGSCPTLSLTTHALANATAFVPYEQPIMATGGLTPLQFSLASGNLPPGLSLGTNGVISGQVFEVGTSYNFDVRVEDACTPPQTATASFTLNISCSALNITTTTLPGTPLNTFYDYQLVASGGDPPVTFMLTAGALPTGVSLSSTGILFGDAIAAGTFNFTVQAMDECPTGIQTDTQDLSITVTASACPQIVVGAASPPDGFPGFPYSYQFSATGGSGNIRFRVGGGTLPLGLTLDEVTGILSGTPGQGGNFRADIVFFDQCAPVQEVTRSVIVHII